MTRIIGVPGASSLGRTLYVCSLSLALLACSAAGQPRTEFDGARALADVATQVGYGPRVPNSGGHRKTGDWILQRLRAAADSVEVQAWVHVSGTGDSLRLRNFIGRFRPAVKERILFLAHWDTRPRADKSPNLADQQRPIDGANDGGSGVAILLGVADVLKRIPPAVGVDLLFVDGEDYGDFISPYHDVLIGSRYYAQHLAPDDRPMFAVLFDMVGDQDLEFLQEGHSVQRAPEVVDRVWTKARDLGYGRVFRATVGGPITDDHVPLLDAGIRAIDVIDLDYGPDNSYHHTVEDTLDKISRRSLQVVGDVAVALTK